jgi:hypothetical protein
MKQPLGHRVAIAAGVLAFGLVIGFAAAQDDSGLKQARPSAPDTSIPEKILPPQQGIPSPPATIGRGRAESPSEKLERSEGIIPPLNSDPDLRVPPPGRDPNTIIPQPGSPGNPSLDRTK